jgi:hypothetical protein
VMSGEEEAADAAELARRPRLWELGMMGCWRQNHNPCQRQVSWVYI